MKEIKSSINHISLDSGRILFRKHDGYYDIDGNKWKVQKYVAMREDTISQRRDKRC